MRIATLLVQLYQSQGGEIASTEALNDTTLLLHNTTLDQLKSAIKKAKDSEEEQPFFTSNVAWNMPNELQMQIQLFILLETMAGSVRVTMCNSESAFAIREQLQCVSVENGEIEYLSGARKKPRNTRIPRKEIIFDAIRECRRKEFLFTSPLIYNSECQNAYAGSKNNAPTIGKNI